MNPSSSIRAKLARGFEPSELPRIKQLWVRHAIAEDRRDIDGLISTLAPDCVYEIVVTGQRWEGHDGARQFYEGGTSGPTIRQCRVPWRSLASAFSGLLPPSSYRRAAPRHPRRRS